MLKKYETVCLRFCSYHKPGKKEQLACRGYVVIEGLLARRVPVDFVRRTVAGDAAVIGAVARRLCPACAFRTDGCDFAVDGKARPCGGLLFLAQQLGEGIIAVEDLE